MPHTEVPVKVNAWVDEGVAPLVLALNELDGVQTLESCENGAVGHAFVFFTYGCDWKELATLLQEVSEALSERNVRCGQELELRWLGTNTTPRAQIIVRPEHVGLLSESLTEAAPSINARMMESVGDRKRKAPQHLKGCWDRP